MNTACGTRITFQRVNFSIGSFNEIKCNLPRELIVFYKRFYPFEYCGMIDVMKGNCRTLTRCKVEGYAACAVTCPLWTML